MSVPGLNEHFHVSYDSFSINRDDFQLPDHFDVFAPDFVNQVDLQCLSVIVPNPAKGATRWTLNGRWITIGIYRDEGRPSSQRPATTGLSWSRVGSKLTIVDPAGHRLRPGDVVNVYNTNIGQLLKRKITIINSTTFRVDTLLIGDLSGASGSYQPATMYNFYEQNYVFRLLPSFKLIPYSKIQELITTSAPIQSPQYRELYDVTKNSMVKTPRNKTIDVNYDPPRSSSAIPRTKLARRFDQRYDHLGNPLQIDYRIDGMPLEKYPYDELRRSDQRRLNSPIVNLPGNNRVVVYDFYGFEINDVNRGPYHRDDLITRDVDKPAPYGNIKRVTNNGVPYYSGKLFDSFGNLVIGIQTNNLTTVRENLLPLKLDQFNRPIKPPIAKIGQLQGYAQ